MLQALLVTFREGIEAFLIVGIVVAYLKKTQRTGLIRGVRIGLGLSIVTCLGGAWLWLQVPNQPLYEGIAALVAALVVGVLLIQMLRAGPHIRRDIEARVGNVAGIEGAPASPQAIAGVALVTTLLVTREGLEAVFYLGVQALALHASQVRAEAALVLTGAALGLVGAGLVAWSWTHWGRRLNMGAILKVTALFLGLFLVQLLVYGIHELAESGVIQGSQAFHDATEMFGPDGRIGHVLSYSLLAAPLLYVLWARRQKRTSRQSGA
jgi:high-affinity iron transporter